ncbi:MAG: Asp-tRNA(Asn)/Glu-tRNA(Gln) amidotransferase subunit GatB [Verrucomicrobiota bacterium]|jgi:aspartyl-tRNA(Asn)/glutamyl-tRNA(Gln) amidotransferase subunit B|nr:Asp-tRNA(Asn)/Glu-tRNA(Gln) amidotransferase subunit GatB [Verrucomicrobiota bacterium]MDP7049215.1 Asp-tRNA(Asn)/Glu-tRNA(Gln) amidotransferase subunit GatB [Verrucomicrobiota bacterium]
MEYEAVIGLETHCQLKTKSKMFCGCANEFGAEPNTNVCPVCLGLPGVLPVPNERALQLTALTGYLLNCEVPGFAKFDRKNYFYPDVCKDYQITQFDFPSTTTGHVDFEFGGGIERVRITRAHLEEDVGKNSHFDQHSGVDFNRAGVPLLEIVSEPDLGSADMAYEYLNALKDILIYGGISDCDMEKGMVRCDVNISVRPKGNEELGVKVEIKNMNTFSGVRRAINYEVPRQIETIECGGTLVQETRRWDDVAGITESMRTKEHAHDYRYFPEPDLMPLKPDNAWLAEVRSQMVELPLVRKQRFVNDYGITAQDADVFVGNVPLGGFFEQAVEGSDNPKAIANWVINNLQAHLTEAETSVGDLKFAPEAIRELVEIIDEGTISSKGAQEVFAELFEHGGSPKSIVDAKGLAQVSDSVELQKWCQDAIDANPGPVDDVRNGKENAINFLKGQVMKSSRGKANPQLVGETLVKLIKG